MLLRTTYSLYSFILLCVAVTCIVVAKPSSANERFVLEDVQVNLIDHVLIPAREAGVVAELHVQPGAYVKKGDVLARMDDTLLAVQREAAAAETKLARMASDNDVDLRFANKSQAFSEAEFKRAMDATDSFSKSVSRSELDQARLASERAILAAEQAARDLEASAVQCELRMKQQKLLDKRLEMMNVAAPIDGVVVEIYPQAGGWVAGGAPIARIIRLDQLRVEGFVDGSQYDRELLGTEVSLQVTLPPGEQSTEFTGSISFVSPEVNPVTGQIRFWADIENPEYRLRPGTRGELAIGDSTPQRTATLDRTID